jgi:hypothetical protein
MADAPKLNSATDATATRYAPLSWAAVASLAVAVVFALTLLALGWNAYSNGQPLFMPLLFALPALGIFLAFLARRHIRNSEGARTGEAYANVGWWTCVVVGACYFAYLIANDLSVRTEAESRMAEWADDLGKGNPTDPTDPHVWRAFEGTLDPGAPVIVNPREWDRSKPRPTPLAVPAAAHSPQAAGPFAQFRNTPLLLVWARNRDAARFTPNGLKIWDLSPDGKLRCEVAGTLTCPEGEFPAVVPMAATSDPKKKKRSWQVVPTPQFQYAELDRAARTRYGWLVLALERRAFEAADQTLVDAWLRQQPPAVPPADDFFARSNGQPHTNDPFTRPDGTKVSDARAVLREVWERPRAAGLGVPAAPTALPGFPKTATGFRTPEVAPRFALVDTSDPARVVVRVTVDFKPPRDEYRRSKQFYTGHLVLVCDDPAVLKELAQARQEAVDGKDRPKTEPPPELGDRPFPFRVIRLESDLMPLLVPEAGPAGAGGPPGG